jgi:hypothetical protein
MNIFSKSLIPALALIAIGVPIVSKAAFAQTDEIQVYDAEIEELGKFNVMVHNNFTPCFRYARACSAALSFPTRYLKPARLFGSG